MLYILIVLAIVFISSLNLVDAGNCEVCVKVVETVVNRVEKKTETSIEAELQNFCDSATGKEQKLCYYIDTVKRDISKPVIAGVPAIKICERIAKKDSQVCELSYPVERTLKGLDLNTFKVGELKQLLRDRGAECRGCSEKAEFIEKVKEVAHEEL
eukprot:c17185_g1_i1.p1 GENE.c17185_g1_i1~~c17185_g1_i1.p1  ORF type:complete len:156 (+),score=59.03 c17185_g1_i1:70-537(+)